MDGYILKQDVLNLAKSYYYIDEDGFDVEWLFNKEPIIFKNDVENLPPIEVKPVRKGYWMGIKCSACGKDWDENMVAHGEDWGYFDPMPQFCPNCGAEMY